MCPTWLTLSHKVTDIVHMRDSLCLFRKSLQSLKNIVSSVYVSATHSNTPLAIPTMMGRHALGS